MTIRFLEGPASIQGSQEWLEFRRMKIGSSDAPCIMNVGFKTPLQLFESKIENIPTVENEAMRRGKRLEPLALDHLIHHLDIKLQPAVILHPNPSMDWHFSSVDGIGQASDGSWVVAEIKCPGKKDHELALSGRIPPKYIPQLNHILEDCKSVDKILYCSYSETSIALRWYMRDECVLHHQFAEELSFFTRMISFNPPAPTERDWVRLNDSDIVEKARRYVLMHSYFKDIEKQRDETRDELIKAIGDLRRAQIENTHIQKISRKGQIDYTAIPELEGINLELYRRKPIVSYRID